MGMPIESGGAGGGGRSHRERLPAAELICYSPGGHREHVLDPGNLSSRIGCRGAADWEGGWGWIITSHWNGNAHLSLDVYAVERCKPLLSLLLLGEGGSFEGQPAGRHPYLVEHLKKKRKT